MKNATVKVNPDLQRERDKCTFNITELTNLNDGGKDKTLERHRRGNNSYFVFYILLDQRS